MDDRWVLAKARIPNSAAVVTCCPACIAAANDWPVLAEVRTDAPAVADVKIESAVSQTPANDALVDDAPATAPDGSVFRRYDQPGDVGWAGWYEEPGGTILGFQTLTGLYVPRDVTIELDDGGDPKPPVIAATASSAGTQDLGGGGVSRDVP